MNDKPTPHIDYFECLRWAQDQLGSNAHVHSRELGIAMYSYACGRLRALTDVAVDRMPMNGDKQGQENDASSNK